MHVKTIRLFQVNISKTMNMEDDESTSSDCRTIVFINFHPFDCRSLLRCESNRDERKSSKIRRRRVYARAHRRSGHDEPDYFDHPRNPLVTWNVEAAVA